MECLIKLKAKNVDLMEFKVNFANIHFLAKDMSKIEPYDFPLIIFNFDIGSSNTNKDTKGIFFTSKELWDKLYEKGKLPKQSIDPELIKA